MLVFFTYPMLAQSKLKQSNTLMQAAFAKAIYNTGLETPATENAQGVEFRDTEIEYNIGNTDYDLLTNYSGCNRISGDAAGNVYATWTQGFDTPPNYPDRGTGYNRLDGITKEWLEIPSERLEAEVRTGWPNHVITESGTEFIVNHVFTEGEYRLHTLRREAGETEWTEADIPSETPVGVLWPRAAVSGETVHVMAITTPTGGLGGELYEGVDIHPLYYRSSDGGATWEVTDFVIPGLDSTFTKDLVSADSYYMDARDDVVAIGIFSQWNDIAAFKSTDGGDTWEKHIIFDFPLDLYEIDSGYTFEEIPLDTLAPDSLAIFTSDNSGTILIDKEGMVHAWYGEMYVQDADTTDGGWTYYPATSGLAYWNETFGEDSTRTIADVVDLNGNDTLDIVDISNIGTYFMSLTSMPTPSVDNLNRLYLIYSGVMEGEDFLDLNDNQHYRHLFLIFSEDGGETWSEPFDLININTVEDELFIDIIEAIAPSQVRDITDELKYIYQQDFRPGWSTRGDNDPTETNFINYVTVSLSDFVVGTEEVTQAAFFKMTLQPNPSSAVSLLSFELETNTKVSLDLFNSMGQYISNISQDDMPAGLNQVSINVNHLNKGMYLLRLQTEDKIAVQKLIVD